MVELNDILDKYAIVANGFFGVKELWKTEKNAGLHSLTRKVMIRAPAIATDVPSAFHACHTTANSS
jgi:hypothetical protein